MKNLGYSYEEVKRERLMATLSGLVHELAFYDDLKLYESKNLETQVDYKETTATVIDALSCLEDEEFTEFKKKLVELFYEIL